MSEIQYDPTKFEIEGSTLKKYVGSDRYVAIPEGVTEIAEKAFWHLYHVEEIAIPESVVKIGDLAFCHCHKLKSIIIPKSVTEMGYGLFYRCYELKRATIKPRLVKLEKETFEGCSSLATVTLPDSLKEIGSTAFRFCHGLKKIALPQGLTTIGYCAFTTSGLLSMFIPASVVKIDDCVFSNCDELICISCEAKSKPEGWSESWIERLPWRKDNQPKVVWGCKRKS